VPGLPDHEPFHLNSTLVFADPKLPRMKLPLLLLSLLPALTAAGQATPTNAPARLYPLDAVRLLEGPFADAVAANRQYLLALDPDRLLAPFLREAGLEPRARPYGNWESTGLDGHTAGHYLSALSGMIAADADTADGELRRRLRHCLAELARCQAAGGDGYIGGVPNGRKLWEDVAAGRIQAHNFGLNGRWVPWYNVHKTFAGLRDAALLAGEPQARELLVRLGDWCVKLLEPLTDEQVQDMLRAEHGGMNEVLADLYAMTGEARYLAAARRLNHRAVLDPLIRREDRLTGLHANTQIPKVNGLARIAQLTGDEAARGGAEFFWDNVVTRRSVAFGGNSVAEHFNDPRDFRRMLEHREGPETCNTHNLLRLTTHLFVQQPAARLADFYERALFNHILSSLHPREPGFVYFTPIRPAHYRVYSRPDQCFWCCVGTGIENPGLYGAFIYAAAPDGLFVNLFLPSTLADARLGLKLRQETTFPDAPRTRLRFDLEQPRTFTVHLRHPGWVADGALAARLNGEPLPLASQPARYAVLRREWRAGDVLEIELPMRTTVERLPDGSDWVALLHGPVVLVAPAGTNDLVGLRADDSRMGHIARGPLVPLEQAPVLLCAADEVARQVTPDPAAGPLHFRLRNVVEPAQADGLPLVPFFRLHDQRYQMYWELTSPAALAERRERLAAAERARAEREARTLDWVAAGQQQSEVEHEFTGDRIEAGETDGRHWRRGRWVQYSLNPRGQTQPVLAVVLAEADRQRPLEVTLNGQPAGEPSSSTEAAPGWVERQWTIPVAAMEAATNGNLTVRFGVAEGRTPRLHEIRLLRPEAKEALPQP
jgi:DUF1680 family protein